MKEQESVLKSFILSCGRLVCLLLLKLVKTTSDTIIHPLGQVKDSPDLTVVDFLKQIAVC